MSSEMPESSQPTQAKHGVGDRSSYYKNWDKLAKESTAEIEAEEKAAKERAEIARANDPLSESHKKDKEKREALKEAKKLWDGVAASEDSKKVVIGDESNENNRTLDFSDDLKARRVVVFKKNTDCHYHLPVEASLIKVFVEECKRCRITLHCNIATSSIELSRCEDVVITLVNHPAHTVQVDLCRNVHICYGPELFIAGNSKIYHSDVSGLKVGLNWDHSVDIADTTSAFHSVPDHSELSDMHAHVLSSAVVAISEQQFVTTLLDGTLTTDVVLRDTGGHPTTWRELEDRRRAMEESLAARGVALEGEVAKEVLKDFNPLTLPQQALRYKEEGNRAFKDCDYGQAGVHYTQAIETYQNCPPVPEESTDTSVKDGLCASLSNRAACSLKLGDHENALKDCETCLAIDPSHVKCLFRKGLALHAMGRYREACPALGQALKLEPKNAQIHSALTFAERKAMTQVS
jgi:hypothetical protein